MGEERKTWTGIVIFAVLTALAAGFIFSNSLKNGADSNAQSGKVMALVQSILDPRHQIPESKMSFFVRKGAHVLEFAVLGICLGGSGQVLRAAGKHPGRYAEPFFALACAVADEFLQSFSDRTSQVRDVLIDFAGAMLGLLTVWTIGYCVRLCSKRKGMKT